MRTLKDYVRNKAHPEGSIAEGYLIDECLTFCSRYLHGVDTKFNQVERNFEGVNLRSNNKEGLSILKNVGRPIRRG